jgi:hypothetical protein
MLADCNQAGNDAPPRRPLADDEGPIAQWLEPAAHNGLVVDSSPAGPSTHAITEPSMQKIIFRPFTALSNLDHISR